MRRPTSSGVSVRHCMAACAIGSNRSAAPSHSTSPRQHNSLPTKAAGKRYMTNHGISSCQRWINASERRSRDGARDVADLRIPVVAMLVDEPEAQPYRIGKVDPAHAPRIAPGGRRCRRRKTRRPAAGNAWPRQQPSCAGSQRRAGGYLASNSAAMNRKAAGGSEASSAPPAPSTRKTLCPSSMRGAASQTCAEHAQHHRRHRAEPPRAPARDRPRDDDNGRDDQKRRSETGR